MMIDSCAETFLFHVQATVLYLVLSRCCIYFGVKNMIFYRSLNNKKNYNTVLFFSKNTDSSDQVIGSKEKKNIDSTTVL